MLLCTCPVFFPQTVLQLVAFLKQLDGRALKYHVEQVIDKKYKQQINSTVDYNLKSW
jgi:hypothetical protein